MCVICIRCTQLFVLWVWHTLQDQALLYPNECKPDLPKSYFLHVFIFCGSAAHSRFIFVCKLTKILDFVNRLVLQKYNLCVCVCVCVYIHTYINTYIKWCKRIYKDKLKRTGCLSLRVSSWKRPSFSGIKTTYSELVYNICRFIHLTM